MEAFMKSFITILKQRFNFLNVSIAVMGICLMSAAFVFKPALNTFASNALLILGSAYVLFSAFDIPEVIDIFCSRNER